MTDVLKFTNEQRSGGEPANAGVKSGKQEKREKF
jgi:hypothetical protein